MDNQPSPNQQSSNQPQPSNSQQLHQQAHDNAVEAGKKLADAELKLEKATELMTEANYRMSNARKFEAVLKERQKKLDRAFVLLNKQKDGIRTRELRADQKELLVDENTRQY